VFVPHLLFCLALQLRAELRQALLGKVSLQVFAAFLAHLLVVVQDVAALANQNYM
jgi:hypothetical protein